MIAPPWTWRLRPDEAALLAKRYEKALEILRGESRLTISSRPTKTP